MLIFTGGGLLVVPVIFGSFFFARWCIDSNFVTESHFYAVCALASGPVLALIGLLMNRARTRIDPHTQEPVRVKPYHSLYFIPIEYWGVILLILGLYLWLTDRHL